MQNHTILYSLPILAQVKAKQSAWPFFKNQELLEKWCFVVILYLGGIQESILAIRLLPALMASNKIWEKNEQDMLAKMLNCVKNLTLHILEHCSKSTKFIIATSQDLLCGIYSVRNLKWLNALIYLSETCSTYQEKPTDTSLKPYIWETSC